MGQRWRVESSKEGRGIDLGLRLERRKEAGKEGTMDNAAAQPTAMILFLSLPPFALRHFIVQSCPVVDSS